MTEKYKSAEQVLEEWAQEAQSKSTSTLVKPYKEGDGRFNFIKFPPIERIIKALKVPKD